MTESAERMLVEQSYVVVVVTVVVTPVASSKLDALVESVHDVEEPSWL
jgi:hypothetical protein